MLSKQKLLALMIPLALLSTGKIIAATSQIPDSLDLPTRSVRYVMATFTEALSVPVAAGSDAFPKVKLNYIVASSNPIKHIKVLPQPLTTINKACDSLATVLKNSMTETTTRLRPFVQQFTALNTSNTSLQSDINIINYQISDIKLHQSALAKLQQDEAIYLAGFNSVRKYRDQLTEQLNDLQAQVRVKPTALTPQPVAVDPSSTQVVAASTSSTAISKPEPIVVPSKQLKIYKKKKHRHRKHHHWYGMHHHNKRK